MAPAPAPPRLRPRQAARRPVFGGAARRTLLPALSLLACAIVMTAPAGAAEHRATSSFGLFGSLEFRLDSLAAIRQWTALLDRHAAEAPQLAACDADPSACANSRTLAWRAHIRALRGRHPLAQLQAVNRFVNAVVPYRGDRASFGAGDYWATPLEFLRAGGDCEDFAVMKYFTLRALGFPDDRLRIAVVADTVRDLPHAVLTVEVDNRTLVLDSLFDTVVGHDRLRQYVPQYSVNARYRWAHVVTPELLDRFYRQASP
jgi:predicted transglutaminase-like cysteine proteinase